MRVLGCPSRDLLEHLELRRYFKYEGVNPCAVVPRGQVIRERRLTLARMGSIGDPTVELLVEQTLG